MWGTHSEYTEYAVLCFDKNTSRYEKIEDENKEGSGRGEAKNISFTGI